MTVKVKYRMNIENAEWHDDNDKIDDILQNYELIGRFPTYCPICGMCDIHIYMHLHDSKTRRGGIWIWCGNCHVFSHRSIYVPQYWENYENEPAMLYAVPFNLDIIKSKIDYHVNNILSTRKHE